MKNDVLAVVLAAGKGTRLHSEEFNLPKVMRVAAGKPLLHWVLNELSFIEKGKTVIVVGYMAEKVEKAFPEYPFALQEQQLGTGHAVMAAKEFFKDFDGTVLVCYGDMPLLKQEIYKKLLDAHRESGYEATILAGTSDIDLPYGRIVRNADGTFKEIVEDKDCNEEQKKIKELNVGILAIKAKWLRESLGELKTNNAQGEYYLTDVPAIIQKNGGKTGIYTAELNQQILGVNTPEQLALVESYLQNK